MGPKGGLDRICESPSRCWVGFQVQRWLYQLQFHQGERLAVHDPVHSCVQRWRRSRRSLQHSVRLPQDRRANFNGLFHSAEAGVGPPLSLGNDPFGRVRELAQEEDQNGLA
jgi:hypothetical protein